MSDGHAMECQDARASIQAYLDGELNEERAGPLRKHLLDCQPCRASAQSEKNLKRWFAKAKTPAANLIPRDFAARVARRAFAGDPGERFTEPRTILVGSGGSTMTAGSRTDERNLRFVLSLTAAAAVLLVVLSVAIRGLTLPAKLEACSPSRQTNIEDARKQLDALNEQPARGGPAQAAGDARSDEPAALGRHPGPDRVPGRHRHRTLGLGVVHAAGARGDGRTVRRVRARARANGSSSLAERRAPLRAILDEYSHDLERIKDRHMADYMSSMEPDLSKLGRAYRDRDPRQGPARAPARRVRPSRPRADPEPSLTPTS